MKLRALLASIPARKREDALWLLSFLLGLNRGALLLEGERTLDKKFLGRWQRCWARRLAGEPLQYVAGSAPFYGREFLVDERVLIPRPETECLVELALGLPLPAAARVLDIGTGSGAIALTLSLERAHWRVTATDISAAALSVARKNAKVLGAKVKFSRQDLFPRAWRKREFDLVVSNPPYLDFSRDKVMADVKSWEPRLALEPVSALRVAGFSERAAWCGERILAGSAEGAVKFTAMELSARVARTLEARWKKHPRVERIWRAADLAGRKRFLLVAWKNA